MDNGALELGTIFISAIGSSITIGATVAWFISTQFNKSRRSFYSALSLHNREDDDRFQALSDDIWTIRMHMAQNDGEQLPPRKTFPRRRYLRENDVLEDDNSAA